ncbi:hypothetical protein BU23DRAFT_548408 [Bimuria novae-zelandiae CBS 107.79]|uniref:N-acetyltransferase domain-containing protein n=1 Tax=Bimuria novae-zelandiae CBS 107.79 TaxID=1447943 RepID=A0A6A5VWT6_9PLEO|nr:hypothetical protein BU23DRAFT_548408 [Bimuria novae-zelandiae CBS 107.79]
MTAQQETSTMEIPVTSSSVQTAPFPPSQPLPSSEITIEPCTEKDASTIAEMLYTCFDDEWWSTKEPPEQRPATHSLRVHLLAKRLTPTFSQPGLYWMKAVHTPTGRTMGVAGWASPSLPVHNIFRRSAATFYGWQAKMGWTDAEMDEMWAPVNEEKWSIQFARDDETRAEVTGGPHWYLAPLMTLPEWQGRGVGKRLLSWAIEQADKTMPPTPVYLESRPSARQVYIKRGFVPQGEYNMLRIGLGGLEGKQDEKKVDVSSVGDVAKGAEGDLAS